MLAKIGPTLVGTAITEDKQWQRQLPDSPAHRPPESWAGGDHQTRLAAAARREYRGISVPPPRVSELSRFKLFPPLRSDSARCSAAPSSSSVFRLQDQIGYADSLRALGVFRREVSGGHHDRYVLAESAATTPKRSRPDIPRNARVRSPQCRNRRGAEHETPATPKTLPSAPSAAIAQALEHARDHRENWLLIVHAKHVLALAARHSR